MNSGKWLKKLRIVLCICAAFGWWGFLYPELTMTPDTYRIVPEEGIESAGETQEEWEFDRNIYWEILQADRSKIRFSSKLLNSLGELLDY